MIILIIGLLLAGGGAFIAGGVIATHNPVDVPFWAAGIGLVLYIFGCILAWIRY